MQGFLHCVWPPRMQYLAAEGYRGEKKNRGSRRRTGCPNYQTKEFSDYLSKYTLRECTDYQNLVTLGEYWVVPVVRNVFKHQLLNPENCLTVPKYLIT